MMTKLNRSLLWLLLPSVLVTCAGVSDSQAMPIDTSVLAKAVVFFYNAKADGSVDENSPSGTGTLISLPIMSNGKAGFLYALMTARHVVDPTWAGCSGARPTFVIVRFNKATYDPKSVLSGVEYIRIDLDNGNPSKNYFTSDDPQVDAALILLNPAVVSTDKLELKPLSYADFATDGEIVKLGPGDRLVSAGLVPGAQGARRNYPIFKFGEVSTLLDEPFYTGCGGPTAAAVPEKVWLNAINMYPGASGAAILYVPPSGGAIVFSDRRASLIGVQSSSVLNADVAAMTPLPLIFPIFAKLGTLYPGVSVDFYRGLPQPASTPKK